MNPHVAERAGGAVDGHRHAEIDVQPADVIGVEQNDVASFDAAIIIPIALIAAGVWLIWRRGLAST